MEPPSMGHHHRLGLSLASQAAAGRLCCLLWVLEVTARRERGPTLGRAGQLQLLVLPTYVEGSEESPEPQNHFPTVVPDVVT